VSCIQTLSFTKRIWVGKESLLKLCQKSREILPKTAATLLLSMAGSARNRGKSRSWIQGLADGEALTTRMIMLDSIVLLPWHKCFQSLVSHSPSYWISLVLSMYFVLTKVNYMSVDTEGSELQALKSFPFDRVTADVIGVEVLIGGADRSFKERELVTFMAQKGYTILRKLAFAFDTADIFFVPVVEVRHAGPMYDAKQFESAKRECQLFQRCLA
jgi:hypothetical protein